ncbi:hypothetical protein DERP_000934, partial [Dermatophagoides pteronyssinus]
MDGELTRIIEQIKSKNNKFNLITPNKLTAKQYIRFDPMIGLLPTKRGMNFDEMDHSGFAGFAKRGIVDFDEMDHTGFAGFNKRRSADFDEMDHSGFAGFSKRRNFDEMDHSGFAGFAKRFNDFDEIDRSGFNGFAKRSANFDEIDHSGFAGFAKRKQQQHGFDFDEMDRSGFTNSFAKRLNFDELDRSGFNSFKRFYFDPISYHKHHYHQQATVNNQISTVNPHAFMIRMHGFLPIFLGSILFISLFTIMLIFMWGCNYHDPLLTHSSFELSVSNEE